MFGYFWVPMSAMCSQASCSASEPDHMNQVRGHLTAGGATTRTGATAVAAAAGSQEDGRGHSQNLSRRVVVANIRQCQRSGRDFRVAHRIVMWLTEPSVYRARPAVTSILRRRPVRNTIAQRSDDLED